MTLQRKLTVFAFITLSFLSLYILGNSTLFLSQTQRFSTLITVDVVLTIPLIYFLLIRKTTIPKLTIIPITILGVVLASYIIPYNQQTYLGLFKTWILPLIEIFVFGFVLLKLTRSIIAFRVNRQSSSDFYTILKKTCQENLPKPVSTLALTELSVLYYGFISWKRRKLKADEYTYHKQSGTIALLVVLILIIAIETIALHLLIANYYNTIAWVLTGISIYTAVQILGFTKSILKRPILLKNNKLYLRYGIMKETEININEIDTIEITSKDLEKDSDIEKLSFLGSLESHNIILHLKTENVLTSLYGIRKPYTSIALSIDEKDVFKSALEARLEKI